MAVTITVEDLAARYEGNINQWASGYLDTQIADAQAFIEAIVPASKVRLGNGRLSVQSYKRVVSDVVFRVLRNPSGLASEGDGQYSYSRFAGVASGALSLTPSDMQVLTGMTGLGWMGTIGINFDQGWQ